MTAVRGRRVVIAGDGVAAAATAMRWIDAGYRPYILAPVTQRGYRALEALPTSATRLFEACGLGAALAAAGARRLADFSIRRGDHGRPSPIVAAYEVVDRASLARVALSIAVENGACLIRINSLPELTLCVDHVDMDLSGGPSTFHAANDATGLSAVWSGRRRRSGPALLADVYDVPLARARGARVTDGRPLDSGEVWLGAYQWAYRFGTRVQATVGVVSTRAADSSLLVARLKRLWSVDLARLDRTRRRAAFASMALNPIDDVRVSVGDAAMLHNPISGEGVRFALASSLAAVATMRTILEHPSDAKLAAAFYKEFVEREFAYHSRSLERLFNPDAGTVPPSDHGLPSFVTWRASVAAAGVHKDGYIRKEDVVLSGEGSKHRWVGAADLLHVRSMVGAGVPSIALIAALVLRGLECAEAEALVAWCLRHRILEPGSEATAPGLKARSR